MNALAIGNAPENMPLSVRETRSLTETGIRRNHLTTAQLARDEAWRLLQEAREAADRLAELDELEATSAEALRRISE